MQWLAEICVKRPVFRDDVDFIARCGRRVFVFLFGG